MKQVHVNTAKAIDDISFHRYGRQISDINVDESIRIVSSLSLPQEGNEYTPSFARLEDTQEYLSIKEYVFGDVDIQAGFCNGWNNRLNALEFHKSSEVIIAVSSFVLILGVPEYMQEDNTYDTAHVECFLVPQGAAVELYPRVLHFAPCKIHDDGFRSIIILPRGTNTVLSDSLVASYLFRKNKWLLVHEDAHWLCNQGAAPLLRGENIEIIS